tara:strand:+ start:392 stop:823 length:432 start_codon:yes stop_codon:yes gene_type:complete
MPLSKQISVHRLVPDKKYLIEVQWNIENNVRMPWTIIMTGTYIESAFKRGRSMSFDTGLEVLLSRSRIESKFMIDGTIQYVSSVNRFYEILEPDPVDFAKVQAIYSLPLPNDIKKEINYYVGNRNKLYYRKKRVIPRNNYTSG